MKTEKTAKIAWLDQPKTGLDSGTRGNIRYYTSQIFESARALDRFIFMSQEKCLRALRTADLMEASMGLIPVTALAPFDDVTFSADLVLANSSRFISDIRKYARKLAATLYKIRATQETGNEEAKND